MIRIAIPLPHGGDPAYAARALPEYERALRLSGAEPAPIPLDRTPAEVKRLIERTAGVLLPGSKADVDPAKFGAVPCLRVTLFHSLVSASRRT